MEPVRVQRKRTKGYKLPPNTVCVSRPNKWGNPFKMRDALYEASKEIKKMMDEGIIERPKPPKITMGHIPKEKIEKFKQLFLKYISDNSERKPIKIIGAPEPSVVSPGDKMWFPNAKAILLHKYEKWLREMIKANPKKYNLNELTGKKLACWCPVEEPCHIDIIIKLYKEYVQAQKKS